MFVATVTLLLHVIVTPPSPFPHAHEPLTPRLRSIRVRVSIEETQPTVEEDHTLGAR